MRRPPYIPCVYKIKDDELKQVTELGDRLFEVDGCGFGAVFMKTEILQKCFDKYKTCFQPIYGYGEDLSFCLRVKELGYKIYADPRIDIGHIAKTVITKNMFRSKDVSKD